MATVQSITNLSLRAAHSVEEARLAIQSRLSALGRVHDLLLQANWSKAKLGAILSTAIEPFEATAGRKFIIRIPDIDVAPAVALPIALILNELCTNAVKYGALSTPAGRVEIAASAGNGKFMLAWAEFNGPRVEKPERRSFGSTLIERAFVAQLRGNARLDFEPAGVRYQLEVPVAVLLAGPSD